MRLAYSAPLQASQPVFRHTARDTGLFVAVCDSDKVDADGCPLTPVHDRRCSVLHINNTFLLSDLVYVLCYTYTTLPTVGATRAFKYFLQSPPSISTIPITIPSHYRRSVQSISNTPSLRSQSAETVPQFSQILTDCRYARMSVCVHYYLKH
jgi:hypothetical protein